MKLISTPARRLIVLVFLLCGIPTYTSMFNSYRPSWTDAGKDDLKSETGAYVVRKHGMYLYFGTNVHEFDPSFAERWHRVRLGYPLSPITIDFEQKKLQLQGVIEYGFLMFRLGAAMLILAIIEAAFFVLKKAASNKQLNTDAPKDGAPVS